jgi:hypothetical protein
MAVTIRRRLDALQVRRVPPAAATGILVEMHWPDLGL